MNAVLIRFVWERAKDRCEYCLLGQEFEDNTHEIDHIIARKHEGADVPGNLALSCFHCNVFKGSDISSIDRKTRKLTPLFNPRKHKWARHFQWDGPYLTGRTAIGRVTIAILNINDILRVELREELIQAGLFPPE